MELNPLYQLIISALVVYATQGVKKVQVIPINDGQKARLRTFAAVASLGLTALTAWLDGNLESVLSPEMLEVALGAGLSWAVAHVGYKTILNK